ncbi:NAD(P)H nitroreductase [Shewanella sp. NIFS-20-20]|uniref:NAD(P)H nitroreductase n=1 Tax=Shewanella sp. NIFS-20-20 TaxID=2853806 RepID=UPI001C43E4A0|nr:NAD(P)H nitroreductase [Shewanella sp. NIFS-20-20]MBV7317102.1 NAD(P)H nitroreductase [Shewanella sp. NIFS-20-20]
MLATELLLNRQSCPRLQAPAPDPAQLSLMLNAAVRAPDHGGLNPWEFIIATGDGLKRLGDIFVAAKVQEGADASVLERSGALPLRAPMVIVVVCKYQAHDKVPKLEQQLAAGCACMAMQQAAFSQGLGAIWRTGDLAFNPLINQALGLSGDDQIVGYLYVGTPVIAAQLKPQRSGEAYARYL